MTLEEIAPLITTTRWIKRKDWEKPETAVYMNGFVFFIGGKIVWLDPKNEKSEDWEIVE